MDTVRFEHGAVRVIAHRGCSSLEVENSLPAFVAAGNRSFFGIEADVHRTKDGQYIIIHDDTTGRVANRNVSVEGSTLAQLRALQLHDRHGNTRGDLCLPTLREYASVCRHYEKTSVLEIKNRMQREDIKNILYILKEEDQLANTVFISFSYDNLLDVRELYSKASLQYLVGAVPDKYVLLEKLLHVHADLDIHYASLTNDLIGACHATGIKINVWTVDSVADALRLRDMGVDYITSNCLE